MHALAVPTPASDRAHARELWIAIGAAVALVIVRSIVLVAYEQLDFDSDQAIVGLMAKHLADLRTFPLFFYGQNYTLGVQAWIAAPFVWAGGATVTMIRLPLLFVNIAVVTMLIVMIARCGLRPGLAFVAALPFAVTTPVMSAALYETLGASVEPFLYVLLLWVLRERPIAFGTLLCVGTLHREFTILALPALAMVHAVERRPVRWLAVVKGTAAFVAAWVAVDILRRLLHTGSLFQEARTIGGWLSFDPGGYFARLRSMIGSGVPVLVGGTRVALNRFTLNSSLWAGSSLAGVALAIALVICVARVGWAAVDGERRVRLRGGALLLYLGLTAMATFAAYGVNGGIDPATPPVLRYVLLGVFLPVAMTGAFFLAESSRTWRAIVIGAVGIWAAFAFGDNVRLVQEYRLAPPPNEFRTLADHLVAQGVKYGDAKYWDCYVVDFLARERVMLASTDEVRIEWYQQEVARNQAIAVHVVRQPCAVGERVASWCIDDPRKR